MTEYVFVFLIHAPSEPFPLALTFRAVPSIDEIITGLRTTCRMLDIDAVEVVMRKELTPLMLAQVEATLLDRAKALDFQGIHRVLDDGFVFAFQRVPLR
jgi:hypothetical protein